MRKTLITASLLTPLAVLALAVPASAASATPTKPLKCIASDPAYVVVDSVANSVAIKDNPATAGNNFGCYTNILVTAGQTITFNFTGVCGGGVPRVFVRLTEGASVNTFDTGTCTAGTAPLLGTVSYTLVQSGRIKSFAFINDRGDDGTVTYSNLVIAGNVIDF